MPRDGAFILSDVRGPTLSIVCEPCGRRGAYCVAKPHGTARRRQADRSAADARQLPKGVLGQHPRSVQSGIRKALISLPAHFRPHVQPLFIRKSLAWRTGPVGLRKSGERRDERRHVAPKGAFPAWPRGGIGLHTIGGAGAVGGRSTGDDRARRRTRSGHRDTRDATTGRATHHSPSATGPPPRSTCACARPCRNSARAAIG
jgi:hypothetical protein